MMDARELTLNIAVNLGRLGRWACEGKQNRVNQFLAETEMYVSQLEQAPKSQRFQRTFDIFKQTFNALKRDARLGPVWAETMLTWANILTHRARFA